MTKKKKIMEIMEIVKIVIFLNLFAPGRRLLLTPGMGMEAGGGAMLVPSITRYKIFISFLMIHQCVFYLIFIKII